jgi:integrase
VATVNRDLRHLRVLFRWAKRRGVLDDIPDFFGLLIKEERRDPTIMPEEDFLALLAALRNPQLKLKKMPPDWWRIFLYLIYYLGVRRGEALGLFWSDISFQANEVRIRAGTSKSRKDRVVPIAAELSDVLKQWKDRSPFNSPNDSVLPWPYDTYRQVYVDWHLIQTAAGIPDGEHYVPKDCRSTCASELTANDVPTVVVRDFLGHASVTTTERYYINTKPAMRAAAQVRKIVREPDEQNQANELDEK